MNRRWPVVVAFDMIDQAVEEGWSQVVFNGAIFGDRLGVRAITTALDIALDGRALRYELDVEGDRVIVRSLLRGRVEMVPLTLAWSP